MRRTRRSHREVIEAELDTLPLMGLFVVLIPMLLLSAVFLEISVIDMGLPGDDDATPVPDAYAISIRIGEDQYTISEQGRPAAVVDRTRPDALVRLTEELRAVRSRRPDHDALTIVSPARTRYEDIINVMDVSRDAGLPQVSLSGEGS
jgi:biopolymer transport protein ExbD